MLLDGKAPLPGQVIKLPNLAKTFRELITHGKDGFYKGRIAQAIVDLIKSKGGVMELEDLANHKTAFVEPINYTYANEVTLYEVRYTLLELMLLFQPSDTSVRPMVKVGAILAMYTWFETLPVEGITALLALGILDNMQEQGACKPLLELEHNSPEYLHALIEALRFDGAYP